METKFTPGPWADQTKHMTPGHVKTMAAMEYKGKKVTPTVAKCDINFHWEGDQDAPITEEQQRANAKLIAAAPDMLKALEEAVDILSLINVQGELNPDVERRRVAKAVRNGEKIIQTVIR